MTHFAVLPFFLRRSDQVVGSTEITDTTETVHGLLRLEGDRVVVQWRVAREIDRVGWEIRTDREMEPVREVDLPLHAVAGATVRQRRWRWLGSPRIVLTAADLRAFDEVAGATGLRLEHPARLELYVHRRDRLAAAEFAAELALARAELDLPAPFRGEALPSGREVRLAPPPVHGGGAAEPS